MAGDDNIIQFPGAGAGSDALLPDEQLKAATAKTVEEWMAIYEEVLVRRLEWMQEGQPQLQGILWERFRNETRPRLRRLVRDFTVAGLDLREDLEVEGVHILPGQMPLWDTPERPQVIFHWPDGETLTFLGESAISAIGFFTFWAQHKVWIDGPEEGGQRRLITPGSAEEKAYFAAKNKDQRAGKEPI